MTRPSFSDDEQGEVDEFDLLEAALRQRPEYIVMGEIRGEEGRTLFQVMSTGHTTLTTFHADSVGEVLKRFTTEPINVSKTMFTALNLVSIQTQTRVQGKKVRRNKNLTEINFYDAENDEINVQDVYQWQAETDSFLRMSESNTLEEIRFDRGWDPQTLKEELFKREVVLAYLIDRGLNTYTQVAATVQAFINDEETIVALMANDELEQSLEDLREMESVLIDIDPEKEAMVPRPDPNEEMLDRCADILDRADEELFEAYRDAEVGGVETALAGIDAAPDVTASPSDDDVVDAAPAEASDTADASDATAGGSGVDETADATEGGTPTDDSMADAPTDDSMADAPTDDSMADAPTDDSTAESDGGDEFDDLGISFGSESGGSTADAGPAADDSDSDADLSLADDDPSVDDGDSNADADLSLDADDSDAEGWTFGDPDADSGAGDEGN